MTTTQKERTVNTPIRQGDVYIIPVASIPEGAAPVARENGRVILAHGEATGHAHAILSENAILSAADNARFLRIVGAGVDLVHEEHATIRVAPGDYQVIIAREWTDDMAARQVVD